MSHLAPSYEILWLSKDKSFGKLALFWYHFVIAKVNSNGLPHAKYAIYSSKTFFIWKNLQLSNKDKQNRATFADILDARIFFTAVGEKFCHPKHQKWPEIQIFLKNGSRYMVLGCKM